jgi:hypothetical protein
MPVYRKYRKPCLSDKSPVTNDSYWLCFLQPQHVHIEPYGYHCRGLGDVHEKNHN